VDGDISDFFGSLSHERLIDLVADRVADSKVLSLIRSMLTARVLVDGVYESAVAGVPQGGVASPLLSNITNPHFWLSCFSVIRVSVDCSLERRDELHPACEASRIVGDHAADRLAPCTFGRCTEVRNLNMEYQRVRSLR
jgi:hypothetical protein